MVLMSRISREEMLMAIAYVASQRSTCSRLQVGAVFSRDGRVISMGYNGAPAGMPHCVHPEDEEANAGCEISEHAERNAIAYAARYGVALGDSEVHLTHAPCLPCSRTLVNAGVRAVTFGIPYRKTDGLEFLLAAGLEVVGPPAEV